MELKKFVKESILQIAQGVDDAIAEQERYGVIVNPGINRTTIRFSVLVTTGKSGSAGLRVVAAEAGTQVCQRLDFEVAIIPKTGGNRVEKPPRRQEPSDSAK